MKDEEHLKQAISDLDGDFELVRELGRGATAVVYLLRDLDLERDVAMKIIRASFGADENALARLQREARLVAQLAHPNIVKLFGTHHLPDGSFALLMEHVPGRNLKEVLREDGALSIRQATSVLKDIASALAYAHRRRIVHRDVKPENIYIDEEVGAARLADFGVARPWDQDARLTLPGASLGTPAYMSPEQIDGKEVDGRSDVYSLGLVGYEMLLGQHPWEGENVFTIIYRQKNEPLPLEPLGLGGHPLLARTLEKSLAKNPAARWESAAAFLEQLTEGEDVIAPGPSGPPAPDEILAPSSAGSRAPAAERRTEAPPKAETALPPVDWSKVEPEPFDPPPPLAPTVSPAPKPRKDPRKKGPLGAHLGSRRGRWAALLGLLLIPATYAGFKWFGGKDSSWEPGGFVPITSSPALPREAGPSSPPQEGGTAPSLLPAQAELEGQAGDVLPLAVSVSGAGGFPLVDTLVLFRVLEGDGILEAEEVRTDANGSAQASLRLPNRAGPMVVTASLQGHEEMETVFQVTARAGEPARAAAIFGDRQTAGVGVSLPNMLGVRVLDRYGNEISGVEVRFQVLQGGGRVSPGVTQTDERGRAYSGWTLGPEAGTQMAAAVVPGTEEALTTFQATAVAPSQPEPPEAEAPVEQQPEAAAEVPASGPVLVVSRTYAVGGGNVCYLSGGSPSCRGANDRGQRGDGSAGGLVSLAVGVSHGCGLDADGSAVCWGANGSGQLGNGSTGDRAEGAFVETDLRFSVLVAGLAHTCGLGPGGRAFCWGRNLGGQLGDGSRADRLQPVRVAGGQSFQELVAGWNHTCGVAAGGRVFCWGLNGEGQVGDGSRVDRLAPAPVPGGFQSLTAGAGHTCGISGGQVQCWGDNAFGQLGDGTTTDRASPAPVADLPGSPVALASGAMHTCALLADRTTHCWGQNLHGQLGDGTTDNRSSPAMVSGGLEFVSLFAGGGTTCGFARDGSEYCWGLNQSGQVGDGTRTNRSTPVPTGGNGP